MSNKETTAFSRVKEGKNPLTKEQFAAFIKKRAELKAKHGEGAEARAAILEELYTDVDRDIVVYFMDVYLWNLYALQMIHGVSDDELVSMHADGAQLNFRA